MMLNLYLASVVIFLLQGVAIPLLVLASGGLLWKHGQRIDALRKEAGPDVLSSAPVEEMLAALPKYQPLKCKSCGAGLLLRPAQTVCSACHVHGELPMDYAISASLKPRIDALLKSAVRHWRVANFLTHPVIRWMLTAIIFLEPLLFLAVLIGSNVFPETGIDRAVKAMGEPVAFALMGAAILGFILWMVMFFILASLSKMLRERLPVVPRFGVAAEIDEIASCQSCGGAIEYPPGAAAGVCGYCRVVNLRAQLARRSRTQTEEQHGQTRSVLFGAMEIIEEYVATIFFTLLILMVGALLLVLVQAIRNE